MAAGIYNIEINQGADYALGLVFNDANADAIDIASASFEAHIRTDADSKSILGHFVCTKDEGTTGRLVLSMNSDMTKVLTFATAYYDLLMTQGGVKTRMMQGTVTLSKAITK